MIEKLTKKVVEVETALWDGTDEAAAAIVEWMGWIDTADPSPAFLPPRETSGRALIWVAHNMSWSPLPIGYRVAQELDGSGFYPLSPEGRRDGYEMGDDDPMPVFVLKAKDRLALAIVMQYREACWDKGLDDQRKEVDKALAEMLAWQQRHPELVKLPDHAHVPARPSGETE